jgi:hypothetical protein
MIYKNSYINLFSFLMLILFFALPGASKGAQELPEKSRPLVITDQFVESSFKYEGQKSL